DLKICPCKNDACAILDAGVAKIETRCIDLDHDKICGNESAFYPPLAKNVKVKAAIAVENRFSGKGIEQAWKQHNQRSAYIGSFELRGAATTEAPRALLSQAWVRSSAGSARGSEDSTPGSILVDLPIRGGKHVALLLRREPGVESSEPRAS